MYDAEATANLLRSETLPARKHGALLDIPASAFLFTSLSGHG